MDGRRLNTPPLAVLGAGTLIGSLFAPWYSLKFPPALVNGLTDQLAPQLGAFGNLLRQGAQLINSSGPIDLTAWDVFKQTDIALLVLGVIALLLSLLAYTGRAGNVGQMIAVAGAIAAALVTYRILKPPGPGFLSDHLLHVRWGPYAGLLGALTMTAGGYAMSREEHRPATRLPRAPASWAAGGAASGSPPAAPGSPPSWW